MIKQRGNVLILVVILAALVGAAFIYLKVSQNRNSEIPQNLYQSPQTTQKSSTSSAGEKEIFKSKAMKFSISIPKDYKIIEKLGSATVSAPAGELYVDRNGTNFSALEDYLKDLEEKNRFTLTNKSSQRIDDSDAIYGMNGEKKLYFIYRDYNIYTFSTSSEALYDELDQIAQSFRYTP